jgi:hypothetical protein
LRSRIFFRLDAVCDAVLAVFLLSSTWDDLYEFLGLPVPKPAFYAQLLGAALVAFAIAEWTLAGKPGSRELAGAITVGSALAVVILVVWLLSGRVLGDDHGEVILWFVAAFLALEAAVHARTWLRGRRLPQP